MGRRQIASAELERTTRFQRWAPSVGILFVLLIIAGFFGPQAPKAHESVNAFAQTFVAHRTGWFVKLYIESVGWTAFILFIGSVSGAIRRSGEPRLAAVGFAGATAAVALIGAAYAVQLALAFDAARLVPATTAKAMYDVGLMTFVWSAFPTALLFASAGVANLRTRALPAWYGWATLAGAAWTLLGGAAFASSGFFAPDEGGVVTNIRYMFFLLWALVTAILLLRRGGEGSEGGTR